jgi:hypothetical protein
MNQEVIGKWALIAGLVIAVLAVFVTDVQGLSPANILLVLFILGLVIGFLNINKKETTNFLIAVIALLMVSTSINALAALEILDTVTPKLIDILANFTALISAAALVVSIKVALKVSKK